MRNPHLHIDILRICKHGIKNRYQVSMERLKSPLSGYKTYRYIEERSYRMKRWVFLLSMVGIMLILAACNGNTEDNDAGNENANNTNTAEENEDASENVEVDLENGDSESVGTATLE